MKTVCIVCPNGCQLTVTTTPRGVVVAGNKCARGKDYGVQEATDPRRVVTAVVRTTSRDWPCVPVRTETAVPRTIVARLLKAIYSKTVVLPVKRGAVLIENFGRSGISVVFTRTLPPKRTKER